MVVVGACRGWWCWMAGHYVMRRKRLAGSVRRREGWAGCVVVRGRLVGLGASVGVVWLQGAEVAGQQKYFRCCLFAGRWLSCGRLG